MRESFLAALECELIDRHRFATKAEAQIAVFRFIEGFYNPSRRHSSIGQLSPVGFEAARKPDRAPTGTSKPTYESGETPTPKERLPRSELAADQKGCTSAEICHGARGLDVLLHLGGCSDES